eukprot:401734-Amphidinium_carterae.1
MALNLVGLPFKPRAWPRASIPSHTWRWKFIHGYPWTLDLCERQKSIWRCERSNSMTQIL